MKKLTAILCLTLAVLLGSAGVSWSADFQKGLDAYKKKDYATALREWKPLAEQGNGEAQYNLGVMYYRGQDVIQDNVNAMMWGAIAAANGYKDGTKLFNSLSKGMTSSARSALQIVVEEYIRKKYKGC